MRKVWVLLALAVIFLVLSRQSSGYACSSTDDQLSVQAQGAQCYRCDGDWYGGDCRRKDGTRGQVRVYQPASTIDNEMPGYLWWWYRDRPRPDPALPPLWT